MTATPIVGRCRKRLEPYALSENDSWRSQRSTPSPGTRTTHSDRFLQKANVLIDRTGHARLADFGMLTIASDITGAACSNSFIEGGTTRWMSPELFFPELFDLEDRRPTKSSDCYAFGMVIYEVLSGRRPFSRDEGYVIVVKISRGERPVRPQGAKGRWFTDDIWNILERCWNRRPGDRPRVEDILHCLEVSRSSMPPIVADKNLPTRSLDSGWEEITDDGQISSVPPFQLVLRSPSEGEADDFALELTMTLTCLQV